MIVEETTTELFDFLDIDITEDSLFTQLEKGESRYIRDLKVNVKNVLESEHLSPLETALLSLSIASNENNKKLIDSFINRSRKYGASEAQIAEAIACASLLASNNVFYRFRHFINKESYNKMPGKIKMQIMMKPELGKEFFEVMSLAISAVNGCEMCVKSHEQSLIQLGTSEQRIWDTIRLASVITSLSKLF